MEWVEAELAKGAGERGGCGEGGGWTADVSAQVMIVLGIECATGGAQAQACEAGSGWWRAAGRRGVEARGGGGFR